METQAISSVASSYPPWVMLKRQASVLSNEDSAANVKTLATGRTTSGHLVCVSLCLAAPPAVSCICVQIPDGVEMQYCHIVAAHGDSVLIEMCFRGLGLGEKDRKNCFIYNAGDAAAKPPRRPSLMLLPPCSVLGTLYNIDDLTGLLRRVEDDELVVAKLRAVVVGERRSKKKDPELIMLRYGEWIIKKPLISHSNGEVSELLPPSWRSDTVFPVNDRTLCWVDSSQGVIFCDVFDESPGLRYVPLPMDPNFNRRLLFRNVCATVGGMVKFVNIFPRCCCGEVGASYCCHSNNAYTVRSWTLRMDDGMSWVMDGMVDSTELWSLDAYKGLPRIRLAYPIVALDEPHLICFMLCEDFHVNDGEADLFSSQ
ncbi:unnamed protein product [Urochloa humidicola]